MPLITLDAKKLEAALACKKLILEQIDRDEKSTDKTDDKYPYGRETKMVKKLSVQQKILTETERVEVEKCTAMV